MCVDRSAGIRGGPKPTVSALGFPRVSPEIPASPRALQDQNLRELRVRQAQSAPNVVELNRLVWRISKRERCEGRLPYLDPTYGGVDAEIIILLKAPQADADPVKGPDRLISLDNDDDPASTLFALFQTLGLDRSPALRGTFVHSR